MSRSVWDSYTDPARQRRQKEHGLPPSVVVGGIAQRMPAFGGLRR